MNDSIYDDLPEDHEKAFIHLERHFRAQLYQNISENEQSVLEAYCKRKYMTAVISAARSLDIPVIQGYLVPASDADTRNIFQKFEADVLSLSVQIEIKHARHGKKYSVGLSVAAKEKIRHYIEQIRLAIDDSDLSQGKRDAVFKKLSELVLEIDRARTRFEIVTDGIRALARLSGDVAREGAEPWWKWVKLILGEIDESKENEPQPSLPAPEERKRLEPPRKQLPAPDKPDEDIPF
ncbi:MULTISPECIES: hypothetical protein [unclassified Ensifer]|uniref:hypothetical protein n=1 Tax=unclassified Ensifer TaxID=2633371 RepID=UPI0008138646|nr:MULTISPECIES: hypothetical protein [unclassified Ensifer]OCP01839.1 hypothetical protein BC362_21790 [Ensifer sp. LC14]OCP04576.1 hypothetical protein BBX50_25135 [Ensifer sp. LC11]OCP09628.1 hypothetical protein BC374_03530 [Ensifer sp. LC13]OCP30675.1 hypothetical protein BC364_24820 [Ensifer sp. LC499]